MNTAVQIPSPRPYGERAMLEACLRHDVRGGLLLRTLSRASHFFCCRPSPQPSPHSKCSGMGRGGSAECAP